ncbi:hypothetical protein [Mycobacteroides chelonae]|nr:hypothetical protein [Mycobacteroides chelonae]
MNAADEHDDNQDYEVPAWLGTYPRNPFLIYHDDDEAKPWL